MLFPCTPYEVVLFTVEKLSFSGKYGLTIDELWKFIQTTFQQEDELDDFQKQTIWQWLFFENDDEETHESKLYVTYNNEPIAIELDYKTFIGKYADRENVRVVPQYEVQAFYLTGVLNDKIFFKTLGEKPYELLQEIAKHGANGIWSPDLVEATGQDNRSLTSRLKKLEDYKLIMKEGRFYAKRKAHSNLIIHMKFASSIGDSINDGSEEEKKPKKKAAPKAAEGEDKENGEGDGEDDDEGGAAFYWRSRDRVRNHIIEACKVAPHQVRVFRDLKRELRLHSSKARSHLFTAITNVLHNAGIVEKINIRDRDTDRLIYALRFVKDPQAEFVDNDDAEFAATNGNQDEEEEEDAEENKVFPLYNNLFPLTVLTAQEIYNSKQNGTTIKAIVQSLCGEPRHRMLERLFDVLPSYQLKGDTLEPLGSYPDEDETSGIMRSFEADGKVKFYKFYTRENYPQELKLKPAKKKRPVLKVFSDGDLRKVEKEFAGKAQDRSRGPLVEVPRVLGSANILLHPEMGETLPEVEVIDEPEEEEPKKSKRVRKPRLTSLNKTPKEPKTTKKRKFAEEPDEVEPSEVAVVSRAKRAARKPAIIIDDNADGEENQDDDYKEVEAVLEDVEMKEEPEVISVKSTPVRQASPEVKVEATDQSTTNGDESFNGDLPINSDTSFNGDTSTNGKTIFIPRKVKERSNRRKNAGLRERLFADSLGELRRSCILEITKARGGVTFSSAEFLRQVDAKLGNSSKIDRKTLTRDLARLQAAGDLEVEEVSTKLSGQDVTRTLFKITEEGFRPSQELVDRAREESKTDMSSPDIKNITFRRTVDTDYTLYSIDTPFTRKRLESLATAGSRRARTGKAGARGRPRKLLEESVEPDLGLDIVPEEQIVVKTEKVKKSRRKKTKKAKKAEEQVPEEEEPVKLKEEPKAEATSIVRKKLKRKTAPEKKAGKGQARGGKRTIALKIDQEDETTLFRAVCISKAFIRNMIDFQAISEVFNNADVESLRKAWSSLRRTVGGSEVINRGVKEFEIIVTKAIEEEDIDASDLENIKFLFFLDLWSRYETLHEEILDAMPLYKKKEDNEKRYAKKPLNLFTNETFDVYESPSMTTREVQLASTPFFEAPKEEDRDFLKVSPRVENEDVRTVFKALFGTSKQDRLSDQIAKVFEGYSTDQLSSASEGLIKDKELVYYGDDEDRFMLTEKVYAPLQVRLKASFFTKAAHFKDNLIPVINSNKGFILSEGISNGQIAQVLQLVSDSSISIGRIDKNYDFEGYESRLLNKANLDCGIVIYNPNVSAPLEEDTKMTSPIPMGTICSRVWLDLNGQIDSKLWRDILVAVLYHFHFRPGVTLDLIFNKFDTLMSSRDFNSVIEWLLLNEFIHMGKLGGVYTSGNWLSVLGS
ncbi:Transcription factor tau subunit [Candida viswanathii]|uniref:Transcription factor tau subunit n=1 Tax=Candida viswanathii TaxID=5486 RepID=A0A367XQ75_9ASCO|nr:Transcription factor tau subunit [Candida viswanathii]